MSNNDKPIEFTDVIYTKNPGKKGTAYETDDQETKKEAKGGQVQEDQEEPGQEEA